MNKPVVSIVCNTYNHEKYIKQALDGFVSQITEYPFEVLVYDDASTDNTANIIREYEKSYPELIKPIYQDVNQYSKGLRPGKQNQDRALGKYIAMCEGDDYWIDEYKLQKQIGYMESHPDCSFCFTNALVIDDNTNKSRIMIPWDRKSIYKQNKCDYNIKELELLGFIPTASFVFINNKGIPEVEKGIFSGDNFIKIVMTSYGYAHYIDEATCVYRRGNGSSVTSTWKNSPNVLLQHYDSFIKMFEYLDDFTNHQFEDLFELRICQYKIKKYIGLNDKKSLKTIIFSPRWRLLKKELNFYNRIVDAYKYAKFFLHR